MDRSWDHYGKQNKSDFDIHHIFTHSASRININIYIILQIAVIWYINSTCKTKVKKKLCGEENKPKQKP